MADREPDALQQRAGGGPHGLGQEVQTTLAVQPPVDRVALVVTGAVLHEGDQRLALADLRVRTEKAAAKNGVSVDFSSTRPDSVKSIAELCRWYGDAFQREDFVHRADARAGTEGQRILRVD